MKGFGGPPQPSPTIAQCLNGGYGWREVKCHRGEAKASIPLDAIRRPSNNADRRASGPHSVMMPRPDQSRFQSAAPGRVRRHVRSSRKPTPHSMAHPLVNRLNLAPFPLLLRHTPRFRDLLRGHGRDQHVVNQGGPISPEFGLLSRIAQLDQRTALPDQCRSGRAVPESGFDCVKKTRERHAVGEMRGGPSESPCRRRLQTAMSCFGQKPRW